MPTFVITANWTDQGVRKIKGWKTLVSVTAYHSFSGEVEARTPQLRRRCHVRTLELRKSRDRGVAALSSVNRWCTGRHVGSVLSSRGLGLIEIPKPREGVPWAGPAASSPPVLGVERRRLACHGDRLGSASCVGGTGALGILAREPQSARLRQPAQPLHGIAFSPSSIEFSEPSLTLIVPIRGTQLCFV
jgi:hypothetical protein